VSRHAGPLKELIVDRVDLDQIWAQIQMMNDPLALFLTKSCVRAVSSSQIAFVEKEIDSNDEGLNHDLDFEEEEVRVFGFCFDLS
jgi:hypothetical protein